MKTPDEIKKGLECCAEITGCAKCPYRGEKCALTVSSDTLAYIQQLEAQIRKWISVKERLPEKSGVFLAGFVTEDGDEFYHVANVAYSHRHKRFNANDWENEEDVAKMNYYPDYWMPMPEPPKEDGE